MCSGPISPMILAHPDAIQHWRTLMGPTKSHVAKATAPHTIRGLFGLSDTRNSTHGSGNFKLSESAALLYTVYCWPLPSNQSFYRQIADCQRGVGDHRIGQ